MKPRREKYTWTPLEIRLRKQHEREVADRRRQRLEAAAAEMREKYAKPLSRAAGAGQ